MRKLLLVLSLALLPGCSLFVRHHYVESKQPIIPRYIVPGGLPPKVFWSEKQKFFQDLLKKQSELTDLDISLIRHLHDYKNLFEQDEAAIAEYNRWATERNNKYYSGKKSEK